MSLRLIVQLQKRMFIVGYCLAGDHMTASGCEQCPSNTYSQDKADSCLSCPDDKVSDAGSTSTDDCRYGLSVIFSIIF